MSAARPLAGIRVVEMSHMIMGPSCGMFLAFMGAEVIKIEPPGGDKTRDLSGMGRGFFPTFNRGKKSVTLDIKTSEDRDKLHKLLEGADVFVENFRDQRAYRMGEWKYLKVDEHEYLFNVVNDARERANQAQNQPERLKSMRETWLEWNEGIPAIPEDASVSLGYGRADMPQR